MSRWKYIINFIQRRKIMKKNPLYQIKEDVLSKNIINFS